MSDVTEQDEVLAKRFYDDTGFTAPAKDRPASHEQALRHELWRTWRILAALREPSEKVLLAAVEAVRYGASYAALMHCIPAAVAAAEREASV
jgi:hypothetical protein